MTGASRLQAPPRFPLVLGPTPLQRAERLGAALGIATLLVKRDDLTGFAVAGNKARKLELLLAAALAADAEVLVTGGGPGSNHIAAAAAAARVAGLGCVLVLYGTPPAEPPATLVLAHRFGATVRYTGVAERASVDAALDPAAEAVRARGKRPYVVPRGGATALGSAAYVSAAAELADQLASVGMRRATVVVATGSCGTQAGLVAAAAGLGLPWRIVGAAVSRPVDECRRRVLALAADVAELLALPAAGEDAVDVRDARGPGYGQASASGQAAADLAARSEGLLLDPVYTAKALACLRDEAGAGLDGPVVFWHTGGLPAALAERRTGDTDGR